MKAPSESLGGHELVGRQLGPYEIVEPIGEGGMATVYKALQPTLHRHVAIKILAPVLAGTADARARFHAEAELVARLEHPHILPIYDYGQDGQTLYIVMPLVAGGTLREWLGTRISGQAVIDVFSDLLDALHYAHVRQVIHRDIKPTNVMMHAARWAFLADFGIATMLGTGAPGDGKREIVGTPQFMSPEQGRGYPVDHRTDLYAMGIMLYRSLAGRVPFDGDNPAGIILQHISSPVPPLQTINPDASPLWDSVLQRSLAKDPRARYASAEAMAEAIQAVWQQIRAGERARLLIPKGDPRLLYRLALGAMDRREWQRAISLCGQVLALDPSQEGALKLLLTARAASRATACRLTPTADQSMVPTMLLEAPGSGGAAPRAPRPAAEEPTLQPPLVSRDPAAGDAPTRRRPRGRIGRRRGDETQLLSNYSLRAALGKGRPRRQAVHRKEAS